MTTIKGIIQQGPKTQETQRSFGAIGDQYPKGQKVVGKVGDKYPNPRNTEPTGFSNRNTEPTRLR